MRFLFFNTYEIRCYSISNFNLSEIKKKRVKEVVTIVLAGVRKHINKLHLL